MNERPIIMTAESVRAILDGRKTQTRRIVKPQPPSAAAVQAKSGSGFGLFTDFHSPGEWRISGPVWAVRELMGETWPKHHCWRSPYQPGRLLWVREKWAVRWEYDDCAPREIHEFRGTNSPQRQPVFYDADPSKGRWRSPLFMPRWASRLTLRVLTVRAQRLHDITMSDIEAEGVSPWDDYPGGAKCGVGELYARWRDGWDRINAKRGFPWASNPWVWAVGLEVQNG